MLHYYAHLQDAKVTRLYIVEANSSDEQSLLAMAARWNHEYPGSFQRVQDLFRVDGMAGRATLPPELYPERNPEREKYPPSMLGR